MLNREFVCDNCGCQDLYNLISIMYNLNTPEHEHLLNEEDKRNLKWSKEQYQKELERIKEFEREISAEKYSILYRRASSFLDRKIIQKYCGHCGPYFQELEIKRLGKISIKALESNETFEDFIENSRLWHQMQLNEKQEQLNQKDKEVYELKLLLKDKELELKNKENEILALKLKNLESQQQNVEHCQQSV